jgi:uncharacterized alkaline shock family protein YloU
MRNNTTLTTAAAVLLACASSSLAQDTGKVQFRLRLQPGQSFRSETVTRQVITQSAGGQDIKVELAVGTTYKYDVQEVAPDGRAALKVTVDGVSLKMDVLGMKVEYDSAKPPAQIPPQAQGVAAMLGKSFTMEITAQGEVAGVEGVETMLEAALAQGGGAAVREQVEQQFGSDAMVATMQGMLAPYPDQAVGVGDSWSRTLNVTTGFPMQMDSTYTLKGRAGGMATLAVESAIKTDPNAKPISVGTAKATVQIGGKRTGEMVVHETVGWTMSSKLAMDFKGNLKMIGDAQKSVPLTVTGEMTVKTTK